MTKSEFLYELEQSLRKAKKQERDKFISYYDEMIADYIEDGISEEEAVKKAGSPNKIAGEILEELDTVFLPLPATGSKIVNITLLILGFPLWGALLLTAILMLLSVAMAILCVYMAIWCIPFATGVGAFAFFITSLVSIIGAPVIMTGNIAVGITQLGMGIASVGIAILFAFATISTAKQFTQTTIKITQSIKRIALNMVRFVKGGLTHR